MARSKTYPRDVRERAVALVFEQVKTGQYGSQWEAICSVAAKIGASGETVRKWLRQNEIDAGAREGTTSQESAEVKALRRENAELKRASHAGQRVRSASPHWRHAAGSSSSEPSK